MAHNYAGLKISDESKDTIASAPDNRLRNALITKIKNNTMKNWVSGKTVRTNNDEFNSPYTIT
jgi:hypothetical protein